MTPVADTVPAAKTVIVADDTAFVRDRFANALKGAGHTAVSVGSVSELLARLRRDADQIDLVVMDLRMPHSGGVELVRELRKIENAKQMPVLVFSGTIASAEEVRDLAALGVAGYVNEYSSEQHILPALAPHLFPDNFNRRSSPRVTLGIRMSYRFGNTIAAALTQHICKRVLAVREIEADSRVAWTDRRIGMGLQFEKVDPTDQAAIDEFIDQHFFSNRKA